MKYFVCATLICCSMMSQSFAATKTIKAAPPSVAFSKNALPPMPPVPSPLPSSNVTVGSDGYMSFEIALSKHAFNTIQERDAGKDTTQMITAQLSVVQEQSAHARNSTHTWYLENNKATPIEEYEALTVHAVTPRSTGGDQNLDSTYCFELRYHSQYIRGYVALANDQRKPILDNDDWSDMICLSRGSERAFSKNFREHPMDWRFKLLSVTPIYGKMVTK